MHSHLRSEQNKHDMPRNETERTNDGTNKRADYWKQENEGKKMRKVLNTQIARHTHGYTLGKKMWTQAAAFIWRHKWEKMGWIFCSASTWYYCIRSFSVQCSVFGYIQAYWNIIYAVVGFSFFFFLSFYFYLFSPFARSLVRFVCFCLYAFFIIGSLSL